MSEAARFAFRSFDGKAWTSWNNVISNPTRKSKTLPVINRLSIPVISSQYFQLFFLEPLSLTIAFFAGLALVLLISIKSDLQGFFHRLLFQ